MSLKLLQPGVQPLGQFDGLDSEYLTLKGGEVVTFGSVTLASGDKASKDALDGYVAPASRTVVKKVSADATRPLMLADEGITGYGTLFGSVVGGVVGQLTTGATLGPHTATGSGKVTCWEKPGLYAVSLDACDTNATTGLQPTNTTPLAPGAALYASTAGLLTPNSSGVTGNLCGRFVEFQTNGSLVTSSNHLVTALNSPSGSAAPTKTFAFAVFYFNPSA